MRVRIQEAGAAAGLTKKAIAYYEAQRLVVPAVLSNGYRDFSAQDVARLRRIAVLRQLGLDVAAIRDVLRDETGDALRVLAARGALRQREAQTRQALLARLSRDGDYAGIEAELRALEQGMVIAQRLLDAFPGYYGRFIALHFAQFLQQPVCTAEEADAYRAVTAFLDDVPPLDIPQDLQDFLAQSAADIDAEAINGMLAQNRRAVENPEAFLEEHREALAQYIAFRQSDAYRQSPAGRLQVLLRAFNRASGYDTVFLPAMRRLSPAYAAYCAQLQTANEKLLAQHPETASWT